MSLPHLGGIAEAGEDLLGKATCEAKGLAEGCGVGGGGVEFEEDAGLGGDGIEIGAAALGLGEECREIARADAELGGGGRGLNDPVDRIFERALVFRQGDGQGLDGEGFLQQGGAGDGGLVAHQTGAIRGDGLDVAVA